jgi:hypothetical protein
MGASTRGAFAQTGVYLDGCFRVIADWDKLHQAVKPLSLVERLVTTAPVGGVVVDPFVGVDRHARRRCGRDDGQRALFDTR